MATTCDDESATASRNASSRHAESNDDAPSRDPIAELVTALPEPDRELVRAHVAALVAMDPAARAAFLSLAGPLTAGRT